MGYRHSKDEILQAATAVALEHGVAALTFAAVGKRLGISDRTVVYYFPTKDALVVSVVRALGAELERLLEAAFGAEPLSPPDLVQRAWPVMATVDAAPVLAVYFEIIGLAAGGREPFASLARASLEWWAAWLTPKILPAATATQRSGALAAIAALDGLLLVRHVLGTEAAEHAAQGAGIVPLTPGSPSRPVAPETARERAPR